MEIYTLSLIAFGLSMDAFSLSLAYGTININKKDMLLLSSIVGIYHYIMPIIGNLLGTTLLSFFSPDLVILIILLFIGLNFIKETFSKQQEIKKMTFIELLMFGFAVSIDSFSIGIGLEHITKNHFLSSLIFSVFSFSFTILGLYLGKKISQIFGKFATLLGGILLIGIGIFLYFH